MSASSRLARPRTPGSAWRATISPDAYQPLSTADTNQQLSPVELVAAQSPWPGLSSTLPLAVSYHWYRKPL